MDYEMGQDRVCLIKGRECCSSHLWEQNKKKVLVKVQFLHGGPAGRCARRASCWVPAPFLRTSLTQPTRSLRTVCVCVCVNGILVKDQWGRAKNVSKNKKIENNGGY